MLLVILLSAAVASAAHRPSLAWMGSKVGNGLCCGAFDCHRTTISVLERGLLQALVLVGEHELVLPVSWTHPSEDGHGYWCFKPIGTYETEEGDRRGIPPPVPTRENTRCVFYYGSG